MRVQEIKKKKMRGAGSKEKENEGGKNKEKENEGGRKCNLLNFSKPLHEEIQHFLFFRRSRNV